MSVVFTIPDAANGVLLIEDTPGVEYKRVRRGRGFSIEVRCDDATASSLAEIALYAAGEHWDNSPSEKAACRVAVARINAALTRVERTLAPVRNFICVRCHQSVPENRMGPTAWCRACCTV